MRTAKEWASDCYYADRQSTVESYIREAIMEALEAAAVIVYGYFPESNNPIVNAIRALKEKV